MKKLISLVFIFFALIGNINAQCTIYLKNQDQIKARKVTIDFKNNQWNYKTQSGEKKSVDCRNVICVLRNKIITFIDSTGRLYQGKIISELKDFKSGSCADGALDAIKFVKVPGAMWSTGIVSFIVWPVGIIVACIESPIPLKEENLNLSSRPRKNDAVYCDCYKKEAKVVKKQRVWGSWGMGTSMAFLLGTIILNLSML